MVVRLLAWLFLAMIAFSGVAWKAPLCHIGRLRRTAATVGLISCVGSGFVQPARAGEFVDELVGGCGRGIERGISIGALGLVTGISMGRRIERGMWTGRA